MVNFSLPPSTLLFATVLNSRGTHVFPNILTISIKLKVPLLCPILGAKGSHIRSQSVMCHLTMEYVLRNASLGELVMCKHHLTQTEMGQPAARPDRVVHLIAPGLQACAACSCTNNTRSDQAHDKAMPSTGVVNTRHVRLLPAWHGGLFPMHLLGKWKGRALKRVSHSCSLGATSASQWPCKGRM